MLREAIGAGLQTESVAVEKMLGADAANSKPLPNAPKHNSLTPVWWPAEFWPKWTKKRISPPGQEPAQYQGWPRVNLFRRRTMNPGCAIHQSVFDRKRLVPDYNPSNLPETYTTELEHAADEYPMHLDVGQTSVVGVHSSLKWADTTLRFSKGETYRFEATGRWYDANTPSGPAGYESPNLLLRLFQPLRRFPKANWFALIGSIDRHPSATFLIGETLEMNITEGGVLHCFANDLACMYWNNSGWIKLIVTRLQ